MRLIQFVNDDDDSYIEVVDDRLTGEVLLDEALKMMKVSERMSVGTWIDLMSGMADCSPISLRIHKLRANAAGSLSLGRRDMERDEDWIPTQTSSRAIS